MRLTWRGLRPATVVFVLVSLLLIAFIANRAVQGTLADELLATPARQFAAPTVELEGSRPPLDLERLRNQPLFYASRAFYVPPPPSAVPTTPPRPDYLLTGTFIIPRKPTIALLARNGGGGVRRVISGEDLDGWNVVAVERERVVLDFQGLQIEIGRGVHGSGAGLTRVPVSRGTPEPVARSVRVLGNATLTQAAARAGTSVAAQPPLETRIYRPPPK